MNFENIIQKKFPSQISFDNYIKRIRMVPSFRFLYANSQLCFAGIGLLTTICFNLTFFLKVSPREIKISKGNISERVGRKKK